MKTEISWAQYKNVKFALGEEYVTQETNHKGKEKFFLVTDYTEEVMSRILLQEVDFMVLNGACVGAGGPIGRGMVRSFKALAEKIK